MSVKIRKNIVGHLKYLDVYSEFDDEYCFLEGLKNISEEYGHESVSGFVYKGDRGFDVGTINPPDGIGTIKKLYDFHPKFLYKYLNELEVDIARDEEKYEKLKTSYIEGYYKGLYKKNDELLSHNSSKLQRWWILNMDKKTHLGEKKVEKPESFGNEGLKETADAVGTTVSKGVVTGTDAVGNTISGFEIENKDDIAYDFKGDMDYDKNKQVTDRQRNFEDLMGSGEFAWILPALWLFILNLTTGGIITKYVESATGKYRDESREKLFKDMVVTDIYTSNIYWPLSLISYPIYLIVASVIFPIIFPFKAILTKVLVAAITFVFYTLGTVLDVYPRTESETYIILKSGDKELHGKGVKNRKIDDYIKNRTRSLRKPMLLTEAVRPSVWILLIAIVFWCVLIPVWIRFSLPSQNKVAVPEHATGEGEGEGEGGVTPFGKKVRRSSVTKKVVKRAKK